MRNQNGIGSKVKLKINLFPWLFYIKDRPNKMKATMIALTHYQVQLHHQAHHHLQAQVQHLQVQVQWDYGISMIFMQDATFVLLNLKTLKKQLISLEIFYSRPLNLHLLYLVCVVNIIFCCSFVFCLIFRF